jgi:hypothetical protein
VDCEQIQELLSEYADDQLSPAARSDVEAHLASCGSCAEELASLRAYLRAMHDLRRVPAPPDFVDALNRGLDRPLAWRRWVSGIFPPFFSGPPLRVAGLFASVLVVVLIYHRMSMREQSSQLPAPVARITAEQQSTSGGVAPAPAPAPEGRPSPQPGLADSTPREAESPASPIQESRPDTEAFAPTRDPRSSKQPEAAQDKTVPLPVSPKRKDKLSAAGSNEPIELTVVLARTPDRAGQRTQAAPLLRPESAPAERSKEEARLGGTPTGRDSAVRGSADEPRADSARMEAGKRPGQPAPVQQGIESLRRLLFPLSGTIVAIEKTGEPTRSATVTIAIPADRYPRLVRELAALGTVKARRSRETPPRSADSVSVRIVLETE